MSRTIPTGFSAPLELLERLDAHLRDCGLEGRGFKSQFIREAITEKIDRESRSAKLESQAARELMGMYWLANNHTDPDPEDVLSWLEQGLDFPPGLEPESSRQSTKPAVGMRTPEELDQLMQSMVSKPDPELDL
jgi:hypothetical protein